MTRHEPQVFLLPSAPPTGNGQASVCKSQRRRSLQVQGVTKLQQASSQPENSPALHYENLSKASGRLVPHPFTVAETFVPGCGQGGKPFVANPNGTASLAQQTPHNSQQHSATTPLRTQRANPFKLLNSTMSLTPLDCGSYLALRPSAFCSALCLSWPL